MERLNRASFVKVAGAATGAAASLAPRSRGPRWRRPREIDPTTEVADEPVVAYVRDAARGEVTITAGTSERTYRDRALVKKLCVQAGQKGTT